MLASTFTDFIAAKFLKGPAGMLYGQSAPGGLFNYVTKKASRTRAASAALVGGTMDRYGIQGEYTGPVGEVAAVRAGVFFEDRDLPRTFAGNRSLILAGGPRLELGPVTLTAQALRIEQDLAANRLRGVPVDNAGNFLASRRWNHNEPSDLLRLRSTSFQGRAEAKISDTLTVDATYRRIDASERQQYHEPNGLIDTNRDGVLDTTLRQYRKQFRKNDTDSFGANAIWSTRLSDTIGNRVLLGHDRAVISETLDNQILNGRATAAAGLPCPLSLREPVYRACDPVTYRLPTVTQTVTRLKRTGFYALDELTLGPVVLIAGIRTDKFDDLAIAATGTRSGFKDREETYRLGAVWRIRSDVSLFAQYATSFEPQAAASQDVRAGGPFTPTTGTSYEAGIKTALLNGRVQSSLSFYRITRQNVL